MIIGTFSKVYKARDLLYENYMPWSLQKKVENAIDSDHHLVAIKLIYGISSPKRVANEISCLSELRLH
jgi:cell division control protein 7